MSLRQITAVTGLVLIGYACWGVYHLRLTTWNIDKARIQEEDVREEDVSDDKAQIQEKDVSDRPIVVLEDGYLGSDACRECHQQNHESWHASYHRSMTQLATPETVVGSFDNVQRQYAGRSYRLQRRGDEFWIEMEVQGPDGQIRPTRRRIVMTTGSHHFQAYWTAGTQGRAVNLVPATYRIDEGRWIPTQSLFLSPPELVGNRLTALWNTNCNRCHATQTRPRIDRQNRTIDTHVAEFGISCEACHGPAARHVENMQRDLDELAIVQLERLSPERSAQVCGSCHASTEFNTDDDAAYWLAHGYPYRPGGDLEAHRRLIREGEDRFWSDGVVRVSGREYHGLRKTPCYDHGNASQQMTCLSCHQMHRRDDDSRTLKEWANDQLKLEMDSNRPGLHNNQACTQCHERFENRQVLSQHTYHDVNSSGSVCYNCHMPHTTWGVMKAMRSHTVTSPRAAESLKPTSRPNACNLCHLDKTLAWTAEQLHQRYGHSKPKLPSDHQSIAASVVWALKGDAGQRALVAWNMGWDSARNTSGDDWMAPVLFVLLQDPYDVIRTNAHRSLRKIDGFVDFQYDFLGPRHHRAIASQKVMKIWNQRSRRDKLTHAETVLLDHEGGVRKNVFERLVRQRDHRQVMLNE